MKIIWAIPTFDNPYTGGEKFFNRLAELLKSKGSFIHNTYQGCKERRGILRKIIINFRNFKILIKQDKHLPIFQNLFNCPEFLLANILLHFFRRKIILFVHEINEIDHLPFIQRRYHSFINYIGFWAATLMVVNSQFTGNWVCSFGNFKDKLFLMYPVIGLRTENSIKLKESQNGPVNILSVGNIRRKKGQIYLLKAIKSIQQDIKITFVGLTKEKYYMEKLKKYITKKGISDKVRFAGFLSGQQLSAEHKRADIFVSPTLKEGFGIAVLSAMYYGLPVVASDVGAISEIVKHGINGLLVEPKNPESLSRAIIEILEKPSLKMQLQKNALEQTIKFKTVEEQFDQFYKRVIRAIA